MRTAGPALQLQQLTQLLAETRLDDLLALEECLRQTSGDTYAPETWTADHFLSDRPRKWELSQVICAETTVVAFVIASAPDTATGHLHRVGVHPDYRGEGLFRRCCEATAAAARSLGLQRLTCTLTMTNEPMAAALARLGWQPFQPAALAEFADAHGCQVVGDELSSSTGRFRARWRPLP